MSEPTLTVTASGTDAPAQAAPAPPVTPGNITDSKGRVLVLKKPSVLEQYRLVRLAGDVSDRYMAMISPVIWVRSIDGDAITFPNSQRELDALIQRLGDEGVEAVMDHLFKPASDDVAASDEDALKN